MQVIRLAKHTAGMADSANAKIVVLIKSRAVGSSQNEKKPGESNKICL